jgi:hypothetical protein
MSVTVSLHESDPPNPWEGYQLALQRGLEDPGPTHLLVLQDDVALCRNLPRAVELIAQSKPDDPVVLFISRLPAGAAYRVRRAMMAGDRYVALTGGDKFCPVVAMLWPVTAARRFLDWAAVSKLPGYPRPARSDDAVVGQWIRRTGAKVWVSVPSLVEHPDNVRSIWGQRASWGKDKGRIALHWIGEQDPLSLNW